MLSLPPPAALRVSALRNNRIEEKLPHVVFLDRRQRHILFLQPRQKVGSGLKTSLPMESAVALSVKVLGDLLNISAERPRTNAISMPTVQEKMLQHGASPFPKDRGDHRPRRTFFMLTDFRMTTLKNNERLRLVRIIQKSA
jgi:hypothetical protein